MADFNPYQTPNAYVEDIGEIENRVLAGRGARLGAVILDTIFLIVAMLPVFFMLGMGWVKNPIVYFPVSMGMFLLLNSVLLYRYGQTIGKKLVGVRIVRPDGSTASIGRVVGLRYLVSGLVEALPMVGLLCGLIDSLFIFQKSRRCIHDLIADTIVIQA